MLSHANTVQGGKTLAQQTDSIDQLPELVLGWFERPKYLALGDSFMILCSASMLFVKPSNNLASRILASHYTVINKLSISVNLIKASLPLRDDRATSMYSIKSSLLTYQPETTLRAAVNSSR